MTSGVGYSVCFGCWSERWDEVVLLFTDGCLLPSLPALLYNQTNGYECGTSLPLFPFRSILLYLFVGSMYHNGNTARKTQIHFVAEIMRNDRLVERHQE